MRVIAGKAKGSPLKAVPGDTTRPITDRTKESLFNIIGNDILNSSFLDCFAGTGSVGIEALSRGAAFVRFYDLSPRAIQTIRENLRSTHLEAHAEVKRGDIFQELQKPADRSFEYIYVAPPQYHQLWEKILRMIDLRIEWLAEDGWCIAQIHPVEYRDLSEIEPLRNLEEFDRRRYGSTLLVFYRLK